MTTGDVVAFSPGKGRIVHKELNGNGGRINFDCGQSFGVFIGGDGFTHIYVRDSGHSHKVAGNDFGHFHALQTLISKKFAGAGLTLFAFQIRDGEHFSRLEFSFIDASYGNAAQIAVISQSGGLHAKGFFGVVRGRFHIFEDEI